MAFTNMKVLNADELDYPEAPQRAQPVQELDLTDEPVVKPVEEPKGLVQKLLGRFRKNDEPEEQTDELEFSEDQIPVDQPVVAAGIGLPEGIRKLWGAALILVFFACLAYSSERALDYAFKEYRWVIGTANPWTNQLAANTMVTTAVASLGLMAATLRTGIYLIRN